MLEFNFGNAWTGLANAWIHEWIDEEVPKLQSIVVNLW
jgi:hypothetical protein